MLKLFRPHAYRYLATMSLSPPDHVRGMTHLDKTKFVKTLQILCIKTNIQNFKACGRFLKPYLLKMSNMKPVQIDGDDRVFLLDPTKVDKSVEDEIEKLQLKSYYQNIEFNYDNWKADEIIKSVTPESEETTSSFSQIGHIIHINLRPHLDPYKKLIGQVLLDKIPNTRTVISKIDTINNEFRNFDIELLAGDDDYVAKVKENKCIFELDFSKVYWNPRLSTEHSYVVDFLKQGNVLFDVFAGVGPFSVPCAKKGVIVYANDLNENSVFWLKKNLVLNKTECNISNKDGGLFIKEEFKNNFLNTKSQVVVTMNLPALAVNFLPNFVGLFSPEHRDSISSLPSPIVFVYCFTKNEEKPEEAARKMVTDKINCEIVEVHFVRKVAPNKNMYRVVLKLSTEILISNKRNIIDDSLPVKHSKFV